MKPHAPESRAKKIHDNLKRKTISTSIIEDAILYTQKYCDKEGISLDINTNRVFSLKKINDTAIELKLNEKLIYNIFVNFFNQYENVFFNSKKMSIVINKIDTDLILMPFDTNIPLNILIDENENLLKFARELKQSFISDNESLFKYLDESFKSEKTLESKLDDIDYVNPFNFEVQDKEYLRKFYELPVNTQNDIKMIMTSTKNKLNKITEKYAVQNMINDEYEFFKSKEKTKAYNDKRMNSFVNQKQNKLSDEDYKKILNQIPDDVISKYSCLTKYEKEIIMNTVKEFENNIENPYTDIKYIIIKEIENAYNMHIAENLSIEYINLTNKDKTESVISQEYSVVVPEELTSKTENKLYDNTTSVNPFDKKIIDGEKELKELSIAISKLKEPTEFEISEGLKENKSMSTFETQVYDVVDKKIKEDFAEQIYDIKNEIEVIYLSDLNQLKQLSKKSKININRLLKEDIELIGYHKLYDFILFEMKEGKINLNTIE